MATPWDTEPSSIGWQQLNGKMWYCTDITSTGWSFWADAADVYIGGKYYAFDGDGFMREGVWYNNKYYKDTPRNERGWQLRSEWFTQNGKTYYLQSDGTKAANGEYRINSNYYYFNASGHRVSGWQNGKYYSTSNFRRLSSQWLTDGKKKYYLSGDGTPLKGVKTVSGTMYLFDDSDGTLITSDTLKKVGSKYYFFSGGSSVKSAWKKSGSNWYYFGSDGVAYTGGDKTIDNAHYWFSNDGVCLREGVKYVGGKYWFYQEGTDSLGAKTGRGVRQSTSLTDSAGAKVTNLSIARNGTSYKATWKLPSEAKSGNKAYTQIQAEWKITTSGGEIKVVRTLAASATEDTLDISSFTATTPSKTYTRSSFYPVTSTKITSIAVTVLGKSQYVKDASQNHTYSLETPPQPTISDLKFNTSTNKVSATVKSTSDAKAAGEWYNTKVTSVASKPTGGTPSNVTTDQASYTVTMDAAGFSNIPNNTFWTFSVEAASRGLRGDSKKSYKYFYIARPKVPNILSVNSPGRGTGDRISCAINTNRSGIFPVEEVILQYAIGEYRNAAEIPTEAWNDGTKDVGTSTSISMNVSDLGTIERGHRVWIRLLSWYLVRSSLQSVSVPLEVASLYLAPITAANDVVRIKSIDPVGANSLKAEIWWQLDNSTKTELSWSTSANAWQSTEAPSTFDLDWYEAGTWNDPVTGKAYTRKAIVYIEGLDEGTTYHVRARRVRETEQATTYGAYSATETVTAGEAADSVAVMADRVVPRGSGISITWEFQSAKVQDGYDIRTTDGQQLASGEGPRRTVEVPASRIEELGDSIAYQVFVQSGGAWVASDTMTMLVVDQPTVVVDAPGTLSAQPLSFTVECDKNCTLRAVLTADGITGDPGIGTGDQVAGDVLYSALITPEWADGEATITFPDGLDFRDGGNYALELVAIDEYGLSSETARAAITVAWEHEAGMPNCEVLADQEGASATITLSAPEGAEAGDVYDVYRMNGERPALIASGLAQNASVVDPYAPYGQGLLRYRVATRTVDGDVLWSDFAYELGGKMLRFDWEGGTLELPYNIVVQDGYEKGVEVRKHLDGTQDAYWDGSVTLRASLSSTVIKITRPEDIDAARALGNHVGPVFVRTPYGQAYPADVQLSSMQSSNEYVAAVSFNATEVDMVEAFMVVAE